jgi:hypothetical protein
MKKTKSFICFEMLKEGYKFFKLFFPCFQVKQRQQICTKYLVYTHNCLSYTIFPRKKNDLMVKISLSTKRNVHYYNSWFFKCSS